MANMVDHILKLAQTISGEVPTDIPEVKSLRWLANMWPQVEKPMDDADRMSNAIHLYCTAAADRMVAMSETVDYARTINAENVRLTAELAKVKEERMAMKVDNLNLSSMVDQLREINAQTLQSNQSMASTLKKLYGCGGCTHCNCDWDQEPCDSCRKDGNFPEWEWKGENHEYL